MKKVIFLFTLAVNVVIGGTLAALAGAPPAVGSIGLSALALASPLLGIGGLREGVYAEVWTGEMIKAFRNSVDSIGWLNKIRSYDQYAENNAIHFVHIGGDPAVLLNNTTSPIGIQNLTDVDKVISLDKYQTLAPRSTDDELYALTYDKMASVLERHRESINEKKYAKAMRRWRPRQTRQKRPLSLPPAMRRRTACAVSSPGAT